MTTIQNKCCTRKEENQIKGEVGTARSSSADMDLDIDAEAKKRRDFLTPDRDQAEVPRQKWQESEDEEETKNSDTPEKKCAL